MVRSVANCDGVLPAQGRDWVPTVTISAVNDSWADDSVDLYAREHETTACETPDSASCVSLIAAVRVVGDHA